MNELEQMKEGLLEAHALYLMVQRAEQAHRAVCAKQAENRVSAKQLYDDAVQACKAAETESAGAVSGAKGALLAFQEEFKRQFGVMLDMSGAKPIGRTAL